MFTKPQFKRYEHVYSGDRALNTEHPDFNHEAWVDTGDEKYIPAREGAKPARFIFRRLKAAERDALSAVAAENRFKAGSLLVAVALQDIVPFRVGGEECKLRREYLDKYEISVVHPEDMETIRSLDNEALAIELAQRVQREEYGDPK